MLKNIRLERPLVVLDLETTGKKVQTDRIVEISLLKLLPDGTNQIKTRRLNPGMPIPAEATAIHGITDSDVANENSFRQIARSLAAYLEGCDLCGYNIWIFDLRMLVNEFKRAEVPFSVEGRQHHRSVPDLPQARAPRPQNGTQVPLRDGTRGCPRGCG
jgi:DNA polymerase III subunit epsilon